MMHWQGKGKTQLNDLRRKLNQTYMYQDTYPNDTTSFYHPRLRIVAVVGFYHPKLRIVAVVGAP